MKNEIIINSDICYICGKKFQGKAELEKTMHHSIPKCIKPKFNIQIPVHRKCHDEMNRNFIHKQQIIKLQNRMTSLNACLDNIIK